MPGIRVGQACVGGSRHFDGLLGEDRVEHLALVREPPVRSADADTGPCRDVVEGDVEPLLGEELAGSVQQPLRFCAASRRRARGFVDVVSAMPARYPMRRVGLRIVPGSTKWRH